MNGGIFRSLLEPSDVGPLPESVKPCFVTNASGKD